MNMKEVSCIYEGGADNEDPKSPSESPNVSTTQGHRKPGAARGVLNWRRKCFGWTFTE